VGAPTAARETLGVGHCVAIDYDTIRAIEFEHWSFLTVKDEIEIVVVRFSFRLSVVWQQ
jgi:hypothetical protein